MTVRCPSCDSPLDMPTRSDTESGFEILQTITSVSCPNCGIVEVELEAEATVTFLNSQEQRKNTRVGHFKLVRPLGQGSFGEVWLADDINLGREVALKLPHSQGRDVTSLLYEAKTAAVLRHSNIVSVYEVGVEDGQVFIASEFIDGITLRDFLSAGKPSHERAIELLTALARALHYAHQHHVVHRDIKPANILLNREGQPYITDFGIAKRISADATISNEGQVIGTAKYMSPEQASGKTRETDHRSDVYALGVLMFEMLTGDVPFRGNMRALLHQKIFEDPPSPRTLDPLLPRDLETICLKCLEREPEKRFASALEFADELQRYASNEPIRSRPISRAERAWRWCKKRPAISGLVSGLFLSLAFGLLGVTFFWREAEHSGREARQSLYRSLMNLSAVHLDHGDHAGVKEILTRIARDPKMAPLRGFEWHYYDHLTAPLRVVANMGDVVQDVAVSRDGDLCAAIGTGTQIQVWDSKSGELLRELKTEQPTQSIDFSQTSLQLASGSSDGYVRIWNPAQDARQQTQIFHGPPVRIVRFSPDGKRLVSAGAQKAVRVWDAHSGERIAEFPSGPGVRIATVRFLDADRILVATTEYRLRIWNIANEQTPEWQFDALPDLPGREAQNNLVSVSVSDDGKLLLLGDYHGLLTIVERETQSKRSRSLVWGRIDDSEFLQGSHTAALVSSDGNTHFYDLDADREVRGLNTHGLAFGSLARSANGKFFGIGSGDGSVALLPLHELSDPGILWHDSSVRSVAFLGNARRIVTATERSGAFLWDVATRKSERLDVDATHPARRVAVSPDGQRIATIGASPVISIWDANTKQLLKALPASATGAVAVQFSSDGGQLCVATQPGGLRAYRTGTWEPLFEVAPGPQKANAIEYSPDGKLLVVAWEDRRVEWLDALTGKSLKPSTELRSEPYTLRFCSENLLAIGTTTGQILLWDLVGQRLASEIKGHTGRVNTLVMLPDQRTLISGGRDRPLKLWDLPTGELITPLSGHLRQVFAIAVSPDGKTIASGGLEGDVRVWEGSHSP